VPNPESGLRLEPLMRAELGGESKSQLTEVRSGHDGVRRLTLMKFAALRAHREHHSFG
jgi:hypothetical protein